MYLKNDRIVIAVGDTIFRSYKHGTEDQFILDPTAITGWTDGTAVRRSSVQRPVSDGDFTEKSTMSSRIISLSGTAVAKTRAGLQDLRDELVGLLADGSYRWLVVETTEVAWRYATVGLEGTTSFIQQSDTFALFKIDFFAPDPHIYGPERTDSISATSATAGGLTYRLTYPLNYNIDETRVVNTTITNNGNALAWPKFRVSGNFNSGFSITNGLDKTVTYQGMVTMQSPVVIDMGKGTATQGGVDKSVLLSKREWFSVAPREVIRPRFIPIQDAFGWCDIIIQDTWI